MVSIHTELFVFTQRCSFGAAAFIGMSTRRKQSSLFRGFKDSLKVHQDALKHKSRRRATTLGEICQLQPSCEEERDKRSASDGAAMSSYIRALRRVLKIITLTRLLKSQLQPFVFYAVLNSSNCAKKRSLESFILTGGS